jgi:hypothetical protein
VFRLSVPGALRRLAYAWGCPMAAEVPAELLAALQGVADARAEAVASDAEVDARRASAERAAQDLAASQEASLEKHRAQGERFDAFEAAFRKFAGQ